MLPRLENARRWAPRDVDRALWWICAANALGALWLGHHAGDFRLAALVVAGVLGLGGLLAWRLAGSLVCTLALVTAQVTLVALQIHLTRGTLEAHFNVFVSMSLLLAYRDWRPVVAMASLFTLHHVVFDRLLLAGYGTYCLSEPDLQRVMVHAGFVVGQAITLSCVAVVLRRESREGRELEALVAAMGRDGPIKLDVNAVQASTQAGQRLLQVQRRMAESMRLVRDASQDVRAAARQMIVDSGDLMQRTQATASELQDAAVCLDQIGIIVQHSSEASAEAKALSEQASDIAAQGNTVVRDVVRTMGDIDGSSRRIADIVGLIDGLAFQTNILALNAAVEAARAGEQGRGFAVVAAEVRSLAQRSAAASREIRQLVEASTSTVGEGAQLVTGAGDTMNKLTEAVQRVGTVFQSIASDADAHAEGLQSVSQSMVTLRQTTQHNLAVAQRSTATAHALQELVGRMGEVVDIFQLSESTRPAARETAPGQASPPAVNMVAAAPSASAAQSTVDFF